MDENVANIASRVLTLRSDRGLTQNQLADLAGISRAYISQIETGHYLPGRATLEKLAHFFGVPMGEFYSGKQDDQESGAPGALRRIDSRLSRIEGDIGDFKRRLTSVEAQITRLSGDVVGIRSDYSGLQARLDRLDERLGRIERLIDDRGSNK